MSILFRKKTSLKRLLFWFLIFQLAGFPVQTVQAREQAFEIDYTEIEAVLEEIGMNESGSFEELVLRLLHGDYSMTELKERLVDKGMGFWKEERTQLIRLFTIAIAAAVFTNFTKSLKQGQAAETGFFISYMLIAMLPYACYLCILNLPPFEYASGKTDMLVYQGIKAGKDAELCMLSVMEIQGQLFEGKSFAEIDEKYYFNIPQLCEDEPLYSAILDLRYRFYLEKGLFEKAADCLNRLALNQDYLSFHELEKIAGELVYMHVLNGDMESAEKNYAACQAFLKGTGVTPKRILASYAHACGNEDAVGVLLGQAYDALASERIEGVKKFEEILLSRLKGE